MIWLVWRRQRSALLLCCAVGVGMAAWLIIGRTVQLGAAENLGLRDCLGRGVGACRSPGWSAYQSGLYGYWGLVRSFLLLVPTLLGAVAGAGLFGREFDQGTYIFALTQSTSRLRWWSTSLAVAGFPVIAVVAILALLVDWSFLPFDGTVPLRGLFSPVFETSGIAPVAYCVLAFSIAAAAGLVMRSAVGAAAVGVICMIVIEFCLGQFLRKSYRVPSEARGLIAESREGVLLDAEVPRGGLRLATGFIARGGEHVPSYLVSCPDIDCIRQAGYTATYALFQPIDRYWNFQLIESAICLFVGAAVLGASFVVLRRRV